MEKIRIILLFIKNIIKGHATYFVFKIKNGSNSELCEDSDNGSSNSDNSCCFQCHFCKTSTNSIRGLKFYDKKTNKFYRLHKGIE